MDQGYFWLNDVQFERLEAHPPTDTRGKPRVDDRRVISGIVHVLLSGCRWKDAPAVYGPRKTLYNRFQRWAAKGVWSKLFHALATAEGPPAELLIDSSAVKAHRCAAGGKGGGETGDRPVARRSHDQDPCSNRKDCRPLAFLLTGGHVPDCSCGRGVHVGLRHGGIP